MFGYEYDDNLEPHATGFGPFPYTKAQGYWSRLN